MEEFKDDILVGKPIIWGGIVIAIIMICWTPSETKWPITPLESHEYYVANNEITAEEKTVIATSEEEGEDVMVKTNEVKTITVINGVPTNQEEKLGGVVINNLSNDGHFLWRAFWSNNVDILVDNKLSKTEKRNKILTNSMKHKDKVEDLFVAKEINENERNYLISCIDNAVNSTMSCLDN